MTAYPLNLPLGFLSRRPQSEREWLSLRLLSAARSGERSLGLPCSGIMLLDVPSATVEAAGLGSRSHFMRSHGSFAWELEARLDRSHPLSLVGAIGAVAEVSRPLPSAAGPSFSLSSTWSPTWSGDWEAGAGVVRDFYFHVSFEQLSAAQTETFASLHADGMPLQKALNSALALT